MPDGVALPHHHPRSGARAPLSATPHSRITEMPARTTRAAAAQASSSKFFETGKEVKKEAKTKTASRRRTRKQTKREPESNEEESDADEDDAYENESEELSDLESINSDNLDEEVPVAKPSKRKRGPKSAAKASPKKASAPRKKRKKADDDDDEEAYIELKEGQEIVGKVIQAPETGRGERARCGLETR